MERMKLTDMDTDTESLPVFLSAAVVFLTILLAFILVISGVARLIGYIIS